MHLNTHSKRHIWSSGAIPRCMPVRMQNQQSHSTPRCSFWTFEYIIAHLSSLCPAGGCDPEKPVWITVRSTMSTFDLKGANGYDTTAVFLSTVPLKSFYFNRIVLNLSETRTRHHRRFCVTVTALSAFH